MKKNIQYEEIDDVRYIVKDSSKKILVKSYQNMVRNSYDHYVSIHKMVDKKKIYANLMVKNIESAPFRLGWLYRGSEIDVSEKQSIKKVAKNNSKKKK